MKIWTKLGQSWDVKPWSADLLLNYDWLLQGRFSLCLKNSLKAGYPLKLKVWSLAQRTYLTELLQSFFTIFSVIVITSDTSGNMMEMVLSGRRFDNYCIVVGSLVTFDFMRFFNNNFGVKWQWLDHIHT